MAVNSVRHGFLCNNSGLSILLHGVISLPDATSYDKRNFTRLTDMTMALIHSSTVIAYLFLENR